jgi:N-carbamoylputrescine amidase
MAALKVALVQARSRGADPAFALREGERACREAARAGADVVLFPELWQIGYASWRAEPAHRAAWLAHATTLEGPFVSRFRELARELGLAVVITYLEDWPGAPRNTATLIDRHGDPVLTYAKVHTCDFGMEAALTPGDGFRVADLDTRAGTVRVGLMICFDREFPESARVLMLGGAELILTPNACGLDVDRLGQFRARAYENMVGVAMANYARPLSDADLRHLAPLDVCNGHSAAFSGIKFDREGNPLDHKLVEAGEGEELPVATFDLDALRAYRADEVQGDAYRKPATYRALTEDAPVPVFARADNRRGQGSGVAAAG